MITVEETTSLALSVIRTDGGTQPRASLDLAYIADLAQAIEDGVSLPPVIVFYDGTEYWLADGFHRYHATQEIGKEGICADIRQGTRRDAVLHSVGANAQHGLRRTNADKRRAVETMLNDPEWVKWPQTKIAQHCKVSREYVSRLSSDISCDRSQDTNRLVERNGTIYTQNTSNIGRSSIPQEGYAEVIPEPRLIDELMNPSLPRGWGMVGGAPSPLHVDIGEALSGKPVAIPEEWELPRELREDEDEEEESAELEQIEAAGRVLQQAIDVKRNELEQRIASLEVEIKDRHDAHVMRVMGSSDSPEWYTPRAIVQRVCDLMGTIDLDPCSNSHEAPNVPARTVYTKDDDGLVQKWQGKTYLNPPYGTEISQWVTKLIDEYEHGEVEEAVALLPARIDTVWFSPLYDYSMCHVRGRIQFENSPYHAPFPCVIVYLGKRLDAFIATFKEMGPIMRRIG